MLHPLTEPVASGWLDRGDGNRIWWEEAGNPDGVPALILHGGPGSGSSPSLRRFFDPRRYRIVSFDQRGCGLSTPHGSEEGVDFSLNTTAHLVGDIEALRAHLGVARWVIYGQSWGTTLGLAYAETHPGQVAAMVFAGVTTTRWREVAQLFEGAGRRFPEAWATFRAGAPACTPDEGLVAAYNDMLFDADPPVREAAALKFHEWDFVTIAAPPGTPWPERWHDPRYRLARARICTQYFRHAAWLEDGELLANANRLAGIPGVLVQGQHDLDGPVETAKLLAAAWPGATLVEISEAGHSSGESGIGEAIVAALDRFADDPQK